MKTFSSSGATRLFSHALAQETVYADDVPEPEAVMAGEESNGAGVSEVSQDILHSEAVDLAQHLDTVFSPLQFPPELARRILTHASHKHSIHGHNARLSFIGRRVLSAYLTLFLNSSHAVKPSHDFDLILARALDSHVLGEHVAPAWKLGKILRWVPTIPRTLNPLLRPRGKKEGMQILRSVGLYKVQGEAVQAVIGGIFEQYGGAVAHRVFHTRILPHILLPRTSSGLLDVFHDEALAVSERMGGAEGDLLAAEEQKSAV